MLLHLFAALVALHRLKRHDLSVLAIINRRATNGEACSKRKIHFNILSFKHFARWHSHNRPKKRREIDGAHIAHCTCMRQRQMVAATITAHFGRNAFGGFACNSFCGDVCIACWLCALWTFGINNWTCMLDAIASRKCHLHRIVPHCVSWTLLSTVTMAHNGEITKWKRLLDGSIEVFRTKMKIN